MHSSSSHTTHSNALALLRVFALLSVISYHISSQWLPSGHLGVVIFLALSGYLATGSLLRLLNKQSIAALPGYWAKRLRRIWPSTAFLILITLTLCTLFNHVLLTKAKPDVLPSLLLSNNLGQLLRGASYFDNIGGSSPLMHLWYLGLDLQYSLLLPVLLLLLSAQQEKRRPLAAAVLLALALISAIEMAIIYVPNADPSRVYYGTDTRAFSYLLGAALALIWPLGEEKPLLQHPLVKDAKFMLAIYVLGGLSLVALLFMMKTVDPWSDFLYRGGMLLASLFCIFIIACSNKVSRFIASGAIFAPFSYLETRSFALYLWHFPFIQLLGTSQNPSFLNVLLMLLLTFAFAEISYQLFERKEALQNLVAHAFNFIQTLLNHPHTKQHDIERIHASHKDEQQKTSLKDVSAFAACLAMLVSLCIAVAGILVVKEEVLVPTDALNSTGVGAASAKQVDKADAAEIAEAEEQGTTDLNNLPSGDIVLRASASELKEGKKDPVLIGDSVPSGSYGNFELFFPTGINDSYVGRRPDQMAQVLKGYLDQGVVGSTVILQAFSNVPTTDEAIIDMIKMCGDRNVFLMNIHIPEANNDAINAQLKRVADQFDNVKVIDWNAEVSQHLDWLYGDKTHLKPSGSPHYFSLIANTISHDFAKAGNSVLPRDPKTSIANAGPKAEKVTKALVKQIVSEKEKAVNQKDDK